MPVAIQVSGTAVSAGDACLPYVPSRSPNSVVFLCFCCNDDNPRASHVHFFFEAECVGANIYKCCSVTSLFVNRFRCFGFAFLVIKSDLVSEHGVQNEVRECFTHGLKRRACLIEDNCIFNVDRDNK